jgi:predicted enzyme related to lactoylglutathione lyase
MDTPTAASPSAASPSTASPSTAGPSTAGATPPTAARPQRAGEPCYIELFTADTDAAAAFYAPLFGWTAGEPSPQHGGYRMFDKDGVPVAGLMANDGTSGAPDTWSVYLTTDDAAATVARATAGGATVLVEPMQVDDLGTMAMLLDPTGAAVGVWQPDTFAGTGVRGEPGGPGWFETLSTDYDRSVAFYRDVFGWEVATMSDTPDFRYSTLGRDEDARAGIMDAAALLGDRPSRWQFYLLVDDTDATVARASAAGGTVVVPAADTPYGRVAQLTDPAGVPFSVMEPPRQAD